MPCICQTSVVYGDWKKDLYGNYISVNILKDGSESEWTSEAGTYKMILSVQEQSVSLEIVVEEISSENVLAERKLSVK